MTVTTTTQLSDSITTLYKSKYLMGAKAMRVYDQLAIDYTQLGADGKSMDELMRASAVYIPFISQMTPGTTAISQTADVTPQTLEDTTSSVTPTSRGEALQWSQQLEIQTYTDYTARAYEIVGQNAMESIELLAEAAACQGTWVKRYVARASLDKDTSAHRASDSIFRQYQGEMLSLKVPGFINDAGEANTWSAIMHPFCFHDIAESGNVDSIGLYQDKGIHLNFELAQVGPFRLVVTPWAKVFGGAGADYDTGTHTVADTLASAAKALDTTIVTSSDESSHITYGRFWTIGTEETGSTFYPTNERVQILSASTVTLTILGEGPNGGLKYAHASGAAVRNADSVYTIVFGGPQSLVRLYATDVGMYGQTVGPKKDGLLDQFNSLGWKYWGNYGRVAENRILRFECSSSYEV